MSELDSPPLGGHYVHWLENVDGDPKRMRTACSMLIGKTPEWSSPRGELLDPNRDKSRVTCPACLKAMNKAVPIDKLEVEQLLEICEVEWLKYKREHVPDDMVDGAAETFLHDVWRTAFLVGCRAYGSVVVQMSAPKT